MRTFFYPAFPCGFSLSLFFAGNAWRLHRVGPSCSTRRALPPPTCPQWRLPTQGFFPPSPIVHARTGFYFTTALFVGYVFFFFVADQTVFCPVRFFFFCLLFLFSLRRRRTDPPLQWCFWASGIFPFYYDSTVTYIAIAWVLPPP